MIQEKQIPPSFLCTSTTRTNLLHLFCLAIWYNYKSSILHLQQNVFPSPPLTTIFLLLYYYSITTQNSMQCKKLLLMFMEWHPMNGICAPLLIRYFSTKPLTHSYWIILAKQTTTMTQFILFSICATAFLLKSAKAQCPSEHWIGDG